MSSPFCYFILLLLGLGALSCTDASPAIGTTDTNYQGDPEQIIKHGAYLVKIMGCNDCHSPKRMSPNGPEIIPDLLLSGYPADRPIVTFKDSLIAQGYAMFYPDLTAAIGPWGMTFAGNLTPDDTGIGTWSEEQFVKAFTEGKFKGLDQSRNLLPPMPVENYKDMKKKDVLAIFHYLKSIKPVRNIVPAPIPPDAG